MKTIILNIKLNVFFALSFFVKDGRVISCLVG